MAAKQLAQTVTHLNCERPYIIGKDYAYLNEASRHYKYNAESDGNIYYSNDELIVIVIDESNTGKSTLQIMQVPEYKATANNFATKLRYKRPDGPFKKGDIIYEYCCFNENIVSHGYNINTMFHNCFGYNFEDAFVISESFARKAKSIKTDSVLIGVYKDTVFKYMYSDSKYGFIPEVGQSISDNIIVIQKKSKHMTNNLIDLSDDDNFQINVIPIKSKLNKGIIRQIKIHKPNKYSQNLRDGQLQSIIEAMLLEYRKTVKYEYDNLKANVLEDTARHLISNFYFLLNTNKLQINTNDLVYVIEIKITSESETLIGDKFANR